MGGRGVDRRSWVSRNRSGAAVVCSIRMPPAHNGTSVTVTPDLLPPSGHTASDTTGPGTPQQSLSVWLVAGSSDSGVVSGVILVMGARLKGCIADTAHTGHKHAIFTGARKHHQVQPSTSRTSTCVGWPPDQNSRLLQCLDV